MTSWSRVAVAVESGAIRLCDERKVNSRVRAEGVARPTRRSVEIANRGIPDSLPTIKSMLSRGKRSGYSVCCA